MSTRNEGRASSSSSRYFGDTRVTQCTTRRPAKDKSMRYPRAVTALTAIALAAIAVMSISIQKHGANSVANHAVTGDLVAYEALSRELTLRTHDGDRHFVVRAETPVHEGAQTITLAALASATGCRAKVWCSDAKGRTTVSEIRISCDTIVRDSDSHPR